MASKYHLSKRRADAVSALSDVKGQIAEKLGIEFPERLTIKAPDVEHEYVYRLEHLAEDLAIISESLQTSTDTTLDTTTKKTKRAVK